MTDNRLSQYIGLCAASHSLICGTDLALNAIRKNPKKVFLMLLADDASERTAKQITDKCIYYQIKLIRPGLSMESLSSWAGKTGLVAACAVINSGLAAKIIALINE